MIHGTTSGSSHFQSNLNSANFQLALRQSGDASAKTKQSSLFSLAHLEVLVKSSVDALRPLQPFVAKDSMRIQTQYKPMNFWNLVNLKTSFGTTPAPKLAGQFEKNYQQPSQFGKVTALPDKIADLKEPLRLRISPAIFQRQKSLITALCTGTKDTSVDLQDPKTYAEAKSYKSVFFEGGGPRSEGITGKYYDAMTLHQQTGGTIKSDFIQSLPTEKAELAVELLNWFNDYTNSLHEMHQDMSLQLQTLFPHDENFREGFLFQNNPPFRLHEPGNSGTPAHHDTASVNINQNSDIHGQDKMTEIVQDDHIYNAWIPYHGLLLGDESATLSIEHTSEQTEGETGFIPCLKDIENEVFIFQAGQNMHKGQFNASDKVRISNDIRFMPAKQYLKKEGTFKQMTGPANNQNVCFCIPRNKKEGQFHVFMDKVFGEPTPALEAMQTLIQDKIQFKQE